MAYKQISNAYKLMGTEINIGRQISLKKATLEPSHIPLVQIPLSLGQPTAKKTTSGVQVSVLLSRLPVP